MLFSKERIGNVETIHESSLRLDESSLRIHESSPQISCVPEKTTINGILFDVDGTLYHQFPLRILMILFLIIKHTHQPFQLIRKMKVINSFRKSQERLRKKQNASGNNYQNQILLTAKSTGESKEFISQVVVEWFEEKPLKFLRICSRKKLDVIISGLNKKGYKLGVYSDYPAEDKLKALGIFDYFDTIVSSNDPGVTGFKPHTNGFGVAAQQMGLDASEIIYVGDRPEVDGKGATEAGMKYLNISRNFWKSLTRMIEI